MEWTGCEQVEIDPCRSMGQPVVKGSRIRAATIVESWELGEEIADIADAYHLDYYNIRNLLIFAGGHNELERPAPTDWTGCDLVEIIPGKVSGKPIVKDSRVMADQVVESYELGESVAKIAYDFTLAPELVSQVLAFAGFKSVLKKSA
jgi:uncharacterized protein (DUF433 family)